jgi:hypothetical protein
MRTIPAALAVPLLAAALATGCTVPAEPTAVQPEASAASGEQAGETTAAERWTTVDTLTGSGNKRGQTFHLGDGDKRLVYNVKASDVFVFAAYIVPKGESLQADGGLPEVTAEEPGRDSTQLAQDAGDYYIEVLSASARWSVKVQEKR